MFFDYNNPSVRYTGRFAEYNGTMTETASGSSFKIAFTGDQILLHFDTAGNEHPMPHLWLKLDDGDMFESAVCPYIRVCCKQGNHILEVIHKGSMEIQPRFPLPLVGKVSFKGFDAQGVWELPEDNRKTIEFVGDSITEGVLIDDFLRPSNNDDDQFNRPFQDDVCAAYDYLVEKELNLRGLHMGYGAVGTTHGGCGGVPKAADAYPFCFENAPVTYDHPDYILINHGANDRQATAEQYVAEYENLLDVIRKAHPDSEIICVSAFCGCYPEALEKLIKEYNLKHNDNIKFIDATLWVPVEPLHPRRDGHKIIAEKLTAELRKLYNF